MYSPIYQSIRVLYTYVVDLLVPLLPMRLFCRFILNGLRVTRGCDRRTDGRTYRPTNIPIANAALNYACAAKTESNMLEYLEII